MPETEPQVTQTQTETPPPETKPVETTSEPKLVTIVAGGQPYQLTEDQLTRAAAKGLDVLIAEENAAKLEAEKTKLENKGAEPSAIEKKLAELEKKLESREIRERDMAIMNEITHSVKTSKVPEMFKEEALTSVLGAIGLARQRDPNADIGKITKTTLDKLETKFKSVKVDIDKKQEIATKMGVSAGGGNSTGVQEDKPLKRTSFKDGTLASRVFGRIQKALSE